MFFTRLLQEMGNDWLELTRFSNRYMKLAHMGLMGLFEKARSPEFEQQMVELILEDINDTYRPVVFSTQLRFLLTFGDVDRLSQGGSSLNLSP